MPHNMELVYPVLPFKEKYILYDKYVLSVRAWSVPRCLPLQQGAAAAGGEQGFSAPMDMARLKPQHRGKQNIHPYITL
jgi:hypothetical protein